MTSLPAFHAANRKNIPLYWMSVKVCVAANKRISRTHYQGSQRAPPAGCTGTPGAV